MSFPVQHLTTSSTSQLSRRCFSERSSQTNRARARAQSSSSQATPAKWRPWTLHPAVLLSTMSFTLGIIGLLEYLQRLSNANHGIAFATSRDTFSKATTFLHLFFPTLIAVLYSTWWSWVDLDVKRLEPWYQLINARKQHVRSPLLLQYPTEFLGWIPFRAARRRHWAVLSASLTMVLILWIVTPLQSGIFRVASATIGHNVSVSPPARLLAPPLQANLLNAKLHNTAYGVTWLGQALPPFTTRQFALAPFSWHGLELAAKNATLMANTTLYGTDLNCSTPASVDAVQGEGGDVFVVDDGQGCRQKADISSTLDNGSQNGHQKMVCNKYFIVWKGHESSKDPSALVTRLCKIKYYSQPVQANVSLPEGRVLQTSVLGPQTALPPDEFNATFLLSRGKPPRPFDVAEGTVLAQGFRLSQRGYPRLASPLAGIAVGGQDLPFEAFINNTEAIDAAFRSAHQLFFALAVSTVISPSNSSETSSSAIHTFSIRSVQLVPTVTRSVQAFMGLVALLIAALAGIYYNRFLPFESDPNSIAFLAALASHRNFLNHFKSLDMEKHYVSSLDHRQATLRNRDGALSLSLDSIGDGQHVDNVTEGSKLNAVGPGGGKYLNSHTLWPSELKLSTGIVIALGLFLALAVFVFLETWTRIYQGLPLPSKRTVAQQIILNYIPTVFGTFLESFLVVVCRYLCYLQPFEDLRRGSTEASKTLLQKYTSLPPQLNLIVAIRNRHFRLASLSSIAILANILTIALSGVFVVRETMISTDFDATQSCLPTLNMSIIRASQSFETSRASVAGISGEPFQVLLSSITAGTPLPPWTTNERFYLPVNLPFTQNETLSYRLTTLGFEGFTDCNVLTEFQGNHTYDFFLNSDATQIGFQTTEFFSNGTKAECFAPMAMTDDTVIFSDRNHPTTQIFVSGNPVGQNALEAFLVLIPGFSNEYKNKFACAHQFLGLWARANISLSDRLAVVNTPAKTENLGLTTSPTANTTSVSLEKLVLVCKPRSYAASYNLTVSPQGQVLSAIELPNSSFVINSTISNGVFEQLEFLFSYPDDLLTWHKDVRARDWMSFFVTKFTESDALIDPTEPLPDGIELGYRVSAVFRRLFAVVLAINKDAFMRSQEPIKIIGQKVTVVNRIFLSGVMYKIALMILCVDILVILNVYLRMPKPFLPRMPTSIASNIGFFAASHFAQELAEEAELGAAPEELVERLKNSDKRFGFGKFVGTDGHVYLGIEREPFVHSLVNSEDIRRRPKWKVWQL